LLQISGERSAQPARYDPDSSRLFARSHEKDGDSWQMTPPQHPNYMYLNHSPTGMMIVSFGLAEATGLCLHLKYFVLVFHLMLLWMVSLRIVRRPYSSFTSSQLSVLVWAFVRVVYARVQHTPKSTLIYPLSKSKLVSKTFQTQAPILTVPTFIPCPCGCKLQKQSQ